MPDRDLTDPLYLQGDRTILCPECGHGIDPHGIDPGGQCGVGDAQGVLCQCFMSPNGIARAHIAKLETSAQLLGAALAEYNSIALEATGTVPDPERGDGTTGYVDWQGVWEKVAELRPHLDAANKRIATLESPATVDRLAQFLLQVTPATQSNCRAMAERVLDLLREVSDRV